ncbi:serine hydrolase domain-containing protein [Mariniflexile sp.]|uniref:serine hydrolase domain-containing protein n=1 Tax=Mariniflexile sp. TaxID=1979402 RepID=UPI004048D931
MNKLLLIIILAFVSCKSPNDKKPESNATELAHFEAKIDSILNIDLDVNEPGVALLISYDGKMLIGKGFGVRNIETKEPITASTNMEMGSVSKQFTALAILSLVDKGKIALNDEVYKFFPYETFKDVTVKHLINHTSGIEDAEDAFLKDWDSTKVAIDERAFYYHKDSLGNWNKMDGHPLTGLLGAGGIYMSVDDYFNYDNALRNNSIFSKEIHQLLFEKNDNIKTDKSFQPNMSYAMG